MNKSKLIAQKRIQKDIEEILKHPIEGISIAQLNENNIMEYVVNIKLLNGIYEGYCLQLYLTFNENYPTLPPKILIFPNQTFDGRYHHHIFDEYIMFDEKMQNFKKFCFDLLENSFMNTNEEHTGWNPSYNISSLLLQVQNFLSDMYDLHIPPSKKVIDYLLKSMDEYKRTFIDSNGKKVIHTWKNPYPPFPEISKINNNNNENKNNEELIKLNEIKENLTCFMLKLNYIDDKDIILGYPIVQKKLNQRNPKIELYPIPELLTYDAYISQISKQNEKLDFYFDINFKSANNEYYNYWIPIYVDKNHYEKNKTTILNSFSIIIYGPKGIKEYDFKPNQIFEILPIILNKMIIGMFKNQNTISQAFIRCYFHYILLFKKLIEYYKNDFNNYIKYYFDIIFKNYDFDKNLIPDIGNFMMLLFFSDLEITPKMWDCLFEEYLVRQMYWMFHGNECLLKMKEILTGNLNIIYMNKYNNEQNFKLKFLSKVINNGKNVKNEFLLKKIIEEISKDQNIISQFNQNKKKKSIENFINHLILQNFIDVYNSCDDDIKKKIDLIILNNIHLIDCSGNFQYDKCSILYDSFKVEEILNNLIKSDDEFRKQLFLEYAYSSQRGNQLLLITFIAKNKIQEKGFLEELEKNYGVLLDVDNLINEIKTKLNEIKSYSDLYKYIGCGLLKGNKINDEIKLISNAYIKAKNKKYISFRGNYNNNFIPGKKMYNYNNQYNNYNNNNFNNNYRNNNFNNNYRNNNFNNNNMND